MDRPEIINYFYNNDLRDIYSIIKSYVDFINYNKRTERINPTLYNYNVKIFTDKIFTDTTTFNRKETNIIIDIMKPCFKKIINFEGDIELCKYVGFYDSILLFNKKAKLNETKFEIHFLFSNKNDILKLEGGWVNCYWEKNFCNRNIYRNLFDKNIPDIQINKKDLILAFPLKNS